MTTTSTLQARIDNLRATLAKLEAADADTETIETIREMLAVYESI